MTIVPVYPKPYSSFTQQTYKVSYILKNAFHTLLWCFPGSICTPVTPTATDRYMQGSSRFYETIIFYSGFVSLIEKTDRSIHLAY